MANTGIAKVLTHQVFGKGLTGSARRNCRAAEASVPCGKAGVGHNIAGPGVAAVEQSDAKLINDKRFAKEIVQQVAKDHQAKKYHRLILVSAPRTLGLVRAEFDGALSSALIGEIPKDLSAQPIDRVHAQLGKLITI